MRIVRLDTLQQFAAVNLSSDPGEIAGPVVIPQCAQISFVHTLEDGKTAHNVLYGRYSGTFAGSVAQANAILSAVAGSAQFTALRAFLGPNYAFQAVTIRDVNTPFQAIIQSTAAGAPGSSASPSMPNEVAVVGTLLTALTGPQNRGRLYLPGWATNSLGAGNVVAAAAVTAYQNWLGTLAGAFSSSGYTLVIGQKARAAYTSASTGRQHPARPAGSVPVTSIVVKDNHWDTQRRRGLK